MMHPIHIHRLIEPLLRLLWPPTGRRRAGLQTCRARCQAAGTSWPAPALAVPPRPRHAPDLVLRGEDNPLVRPYLVAHERRELARLRRVRRRRELWCAVHGIDIGPRLIHGVEVTA